MKPQFIILFTLAFVSFLSADHSLTRGPEIGEIYFYGPVVSEDNNGLYHSTDFGETTTCMDSTVIGQFDADLTPGVIYRERFGVLYASEDYGQQGTWDQRPELVSENSIESGVCEGEIFSSCNKHSEDYGFTFQNHQGQGYFGYTKAVEIDNEDHVAYMIVYELNTPDSLWLLISHDDFDNLEVQKTLYWESVADYFLTRGYENGELYILKKWGNYNKKLYYSNDYGITWEIKNSFNCPNLPIKGIVGGRQPGELYMLVKYIQDMYNIKHTYIYHSLDYGESFTVYHPFAYGEDPAYAYFEGSPIEGQPPLTVQFTDLSPGDPNLIWEWEWDFDNDGIIDSYEQHPEYTYQDTGYYSVRLHIFNVAGGGTEDYAFRENYIHVTENSSRRNEVVQNYKIQLSNYPNPFNPSTTIEFSILNNSKIDLSIYNIKGQKVRTLINEHKENGTHSIVWNGKDSSNNSVASGLYFYKLTSGKDTVTHKMLLLK